MLNQGSFTRDEWNHLLRLFNMMSFSKFSCCHFSNFLCDPIGRQSAMSKREREAAPKPMIPAKARPINLVSHSPLSATENPPQDLRYPVNPVNVDERQGSQTRTRKLVRINQSPEVQDSHVRRQENAPKFRFLETGRREESSHSDKYKETCTGSEHKSKVSEHEVHKPPIHEEGLLEFAKRSWELEQGTQHLHLKHQRPIVLIWRMFMSSSMKATLDLGPNLFANLEIYKKKNFEEIQSLFSITQKLTLEHSEEIPNMHMIWRAHLPLGRDRLCLMMVIQWTKAKVRVYSDSVLCLEKMWVNKEAITRWESQVEEFRLLGIVGELIELGWNILSGFSSLQFFQKIQNDLRERNHWTGEIHRPDHLHVNVQRHRLDKKRKRRNLCFEFRKSQGIREEILAGTLDVPRSWKRCGIELSLIAPVGKWDHVATQMVERFEDTGHPVLKSISALSCGILNRKNNRDTIHFHAGCF